MTPAINERILAGKWVVWWKHESRAVVDMAGNVTGIEMRKMWRHGQVAKKAGDMLVTKRFERIPARDAFVVSEIAGWPQWDVLGYQPVTDSEFNAIITRSQP